MPYFLTHHLNTEFPAQNPMLPLPIIFEQTETARQRWEYHVVTVDLREEPPLDEARLVELGTEGWLLAGLLPLGATASPSHVTYYFLRAV